MHERSLVIALLKQVEEICRQHHGERVTAVHVELGPLSGVEPLLVASAFEQLAPASNMADATLHIDQVALLAQCETCSLKFEVREFEFRCPTCGGNVRVIRGDAFQLVSVSLENCKSDHEGNHQSSKPSLTGGHDLSDRRETLL